MTTSPDPITRAEQSARAWLTRIADALYADDHHTAYRALRAWLHAVRDHVTAPVAVHVSAQLPELVRGLYFEGWDPGRPPLHHGDAELAAVTASFAATAGIAPEQVPQVAATVGTTLDRLFSPGLLDHAAAQLPTALRELLGLAAPQVREDTQARLRHLENTVGVLTDALAEIARGLAGGPMDEPAADRVAHAARAARQMLLADDVEPPARRTHEMQR